MATARSDGSPGARDGRVAPDAAAAGLADGAEAAGAAPPPPGGAALAQERLSPRARLARLAGGPEGEQEPAATADAETRERPVDAPATTALPRPRRGLAQGGSRSARGASTRPDLLARPAAVAEPVAADAHAAGAGAVAVAVATAGAEGVGLADEPALADDAGAAPEGPGAGPDHEAETGAGDGGDDSDLPPGLSPRGPNDERRRRGLFGALFLGLAAIVSCALFLVIGLGYGATKYYDSRVDRTDLSDGDVEGTRPPRVAHGNEVWLLVGSDVRTGSDAAEVGGARSDTMMIAYLGSNGKTTLVSIPRDLKVTIPAYTDSKGKRHSARKDRVNTAFNLGGPALLLRTLENISDLRIDHFAEIDFNGFRQMSTVLGGVEVCLVKDRFSEYVSENGHRSTNLNDPMSGFVGQEGTNVLTGDNALAFVRQRHGFANGDYSRIQRQQAFLAAVFRKAKSTGLLTSPGKVTGLLNAVTSSMVVDSETDLTDLRALAERMQGLSTGQVQFTTIPLSGATGGNGQAYYALYDPAMVRGFFHQIVAESDTAAGGEPPTPTPAASPTLAPSQVQVTVLNGSRKAGAASTVASKLRAAGYQVVKVDTADSRDLARTEIRYPAADAAAGSRLLADIPGAQAVPAELPASAAASATADTSAGGAAAGGITLVVGQDIADGDTTVIAAATGGSSSGATAAPTPYYTQAPVSATGRCIK